MDCETEQSTSNKKSTLYERALRKSTYTNYNTKGDTDEYFI